MTCLGWQVKALRSHAASGLTNAGHRLEPSFTIECVYADALLILIHQRLAHLYDIQHVTFDVYDLGEPVRRKRMYVSGLLRSAVKRLEAMRGFKERFCRRTVALPDMYFALSDKHVQPLIEALATKTSKVKIGNQELTYPDMLAECDHAQIESYLEICKTMISDGKHTASGLFVCDPMHSPIKSKKIGIHAMPTLTCKQTRFSVQRNRCLIGDEYLAAQGIATPTLMEALGEDGESIAMAKSCVGNMSEEFKRKAAGNGMHLHAIGAVIAWTLANAEPGQADYGESRRPGRDIEVGCSFPSARCEQQRE